MNRIQYSGISKHNHENLIICHEWFNEFQFSYNIVLYNNIHGFLTIYTKSYKLLALKGIISVEINSVYARITDGFIE